MSDVARQDRPRQRPDRGFVVLPGVPLRELMRDVLGGLRDVDQALTRCPDRSREPFLQCVVRLKPQPELPFARPVAS